MANEISITEIDEFLASPIVTWFVSCLEGCVKDQLTYEELVDGVLMYDVFLQMDIDGQSNDVSPSNSNPDKQLANLKTVMHHIRKFYEDYLGEVILYQPNLRLIVQEPRSNVREVELLLVLLLGCAVKCRNNEHFIQRITLLDDDVQVAIASYISKVLYFPDLVLSKKMLLLDPTDVDNEKLEYHKKKVQKTFQEIQRINKERNEMIEQMQSASFMHNDVQSYEKELKEWTAEAIALNDQLDEHKRKVALLESENKRLASEAKSHRDALEDVSARIQQTESLERELAHCQDKLKYTSSYKTRIDELEHKNRLIKEKNEELVNKLSAHRAESKKKIREMESAIGKLQRRCNELSMENEANCEENSKLYEENADLERRIKLSSSLNFTLDSSFSAEADELSYNNYTFNQSNVSICEQLSQSAQSHALKLELESRRLETLQENSALECSIQIVDLEKEKRRLELINEDLCVKVRKLEESLAVVNREKGQLMILLEEKRDKEDDCVLKSPNRLEVKFDQLYSDYQSVLQEKNSLEKKLRDAKFKLMNNLPEDDDELKNLKQDFSLLMAEYRKEKSKVVQLTVRHQESQKELNSRNSKILELDMHNNKLRNELGLLTELKTRADYDKKMLMKHMSDMLKQNRTLVTKTLERHQQFYDEEKKKDETLNNLNRAKAKLEDKVMDHYKSMSNRRESKKRSAAVSAVKNTFVKVRRAGSEFFGVNRWSSVDGEFGSKTLDGSARTSGLKFVREPRNNKSVDFMENFSPENFSFDSK